MSYVDAYHLRSLAFAMVCVASLTLLCLVPAAWRFPVDYRLSLRRWTVGTALVVLSDVLFTTAFDLPFLGPLLIIMVGIGCAEWLHALRVFGGERKRSGWPYAVILLGALGSALSPGYEGSAVAMSASLAVLYLAAAITAARLREPPASAGRLALVTTFGVIGAVMLVRVGISLSGLHSGAPPGFTSPVRALLFILTSMGPVAGSLAFVLMCNDHLGDELRRLATLDSLTGTRNRGSFLGELERALSTCRRRGEPLALLALDLDHFKDVNDSAGHPVGDRVLSTVTRKLEGALRASDVLGRIGGEEFAIAAPGADRAAAAVVAERIRRLVEEARPDFYSRAPLTVSIGVAVTRTADDSAGSLMQRADAALYEAKRTGRNRVCEAE
jgi:diguanylate cyclase (GGDEF)-like protein